MIYQECDERAHVEDSIRIGEFALSTPKNALSQQSIVLSNGRELSRTVSNITGSSELQCGTVTLRGGASVPVRRDTRESLAWQQVNDLLPAMFDKATEE